MCFLFNNGFWHKSVASAAHFAGRNCSLFSCFLFWILNSQHSNKSHQPECSLYEAMADKCIRLLTAVKGFTEGKWPLVCSLTAACNHLMYITARMHMLWLNHQGNTKISRHNQAQISSQQFNQQNIQLKEVLLVHW